MDIPYSNWGRGPFPDDRASRSEDLRRRLEAIAAAEAEQLRVARRRRRRARLRTITTLVAVAGVVAVASWHAPAGPGDRFGADTYVSSQALAFDPPPPSPDREEAPIGEPIRGPRGSGSYEFSEYQDDTLETPVAWDPCRPIHYVVNPRTMPEGAEAAVGAAVAEVSRVTGLRFVYDGRSDEEPSETRSVVDRERYGEVWSPVLIAWTDAAHYRGLKGAVIGLAGPAQVAVPALVGNPQSVYVSGIVALDGPALAQYVEDRPEEVRAVILHELGHLVGLDHARSGSDTIMEAEATSRTEFADGDLRGLIQLGSGACFPTT